MSDYLEKNKIPSLLEFLENKIHMRNVMGLSHFLKSSRAPDHQSHITPADVKQEDDLIALVRKKDSIFSHLTFESEIDASGLPLPYD